MSDKQKRALKRYATIGVVSLATLVIFNTIVNRSRSPAVRRIGQAVQTGL